MQVLNSIKVNPFSVMAKVMDCDLEVIEFEIHSRFYIPFQTDILDKGMKSLISPTMD